MLAFPGVMNVILAFFVKVQYGRMAKIRIQVTNEELIYTNHKGVQRVSFDDITAVEFPSVKYVGGWLKVTSQTSTLRMTVVVEDIPQLVKDIKDQLDRRNMSSVYDQEKLASFTHTAAYSNTSWPRLTRWWWKIALASLGGLLIGIVLCLQVDDFSLRMLILLASLLYPTLVYVVIEIRLVKVLRKQMDVDGLAGQESAVELEGPVVKQTLIWGVVGFLALVVLGLVGL